MAKNKKKQPAPPTMEQRDWWNWIIAGLGIVYVVLTATIFALQNEISILQQAKAQNIPAAKLQPPPTTVTTQPPSVQPPSVQQVESSLPKRDILPPTDKLLEPALIDKPSKSNQPEDNLQTARHYHERGEVSKAIELYEQALLQEPQNVEIHLVLGQLYMTQATDSARAQAHLEKVLALEPNYPGRPVVELWLKKLQAKK